MINIKLLMNRYIFFILIVISEEREMSDSVKRLESLKKKCKIASIVLMAFKVLFGIIIGMCIVAIIATIVKADDINKEIANSGIEAFQEMEGQNVEFGVTFGMLSVDIDRLIASGNGAEAVTIMLTFMLIISIFAFIIISLFKSIFDVLKKGVSPFDKALIKKLKVSFIVFTVCLFTISGGLAVMVGLFLWCIYGIFQYGEVLQRESDETL